MLRRFSAPTTTTTFGFSARWFTSMANLKKDPEASLPPLDFDWKQGVAPVLSPRQVELHYTKHHKAYVDKLNSLTKESGKTIEEIADAAFKAGDSQKVLYNQAAQHFNHSFYWKCLTPNGKAMPKALEEALTSTFGSVDKFKAQFEAQCVGNFGSGWTWLVYDPATSKLSIWNSSNAVMPQSHGLRPVFTVDVWEHAYYKDFENRRPDYVKELWKIINWEFVDQQLTAVRK